MIVSQYVFRSGLAPKDLNSVEKIFIALEMGAPIGPPPMASIQAIAVIGNRASIWGDHMLAVCINSPAWDAKAFDEHWDESNPQKVTAHCTVRRQGGNPVKRTFSTADAEKAGLTKKDTPWKGYPKRMLQMRARSWALRDAFPDVLKGLDCAEVVREYINRSDRGQARCSTRRRAIRSRGESRGRSHEATVIGAGSDRHFGNASRGRAGGCRTDRATASGRATCDRYPGRAEPFARKQRTSGRASEGVG